MLEDDAWIKMRRACISLYKDLLLLENFAVMNYCACSKALKKHDKTVGLDTRARFMRNVVHQQPFTHYPRLLEMLQEMEQTFQEINHAQGDRYASAAVLWLCFCKIPVKYRPPPLPQRSPPTTHLDPHPHTARGPWRRRSACSSRPSEGSTRRPRACSRRRRQTSAA